MLTGGTGGLGLLTARWLAQARGAAELVLASRSGVLAPGGAAEWALLRESGAQVRLARCDAAEPLAVRRLLSSASLAPLAAQQLTVACRWRHGLMCLEAPRRRREW